MAKVTCAISGLRFSCDYLDCLNLTNEAGFMHPIFAAEQSTLYELYSRHCKGKLKTRDSYLLFLAFLHSTNKIDWRQPANIDPFSLSGIQLVEHNITRLVSVIEKTEYIRHPSFSQPSYIVTENTCSLDKIGEWVKLWKENIAYFYSDKASEREQQALQKIENKLTYLILSGEEPERFSRVIANWADKVAGFPPANAELWKKTIMSCFSINKMFNTPLPLLKEIKEFCEWVIGQKGKIKFDVYSFNMHQNTKEYLSKLNNENIQFFPEGIFYHDIPKKLINYDIGLILYKCNNLNYVFNAPNKLFEYLACNLDIWFPTEMKGAYEYVRSGSSPQILNLDFQNLNQYNVEELVSTKGTTYKEDNYFCENIYSRYLKFVIQDNNE